MWRWRVARHAEERVLIAMSRAVTVWHPVATVTLARSLHTILEAFSLGLLLLRPRNVALPFIMMAALQLIRDGVDPCFFASLEIVLLSSAVLPSLPLDSLLVWFPYLVLIQSALVNKVSVLTIKG